MRVWRSLGSFIDGWKGPGPDHHWASKTAGPHHAAGGLEHVDVLLVHPDPRGAHERALFGVVETLHLDQGYNNAAVQTLCTQHGLDEVVSAKQRRTACMALARRTSFSLGADPRNDDEKNRSEITSAEWVRNQKWADMLLRRSPRPACPMALVVAGPCACWDSRVCRGVPITDTILAGRKSQPGDSHSRSAPHCSSLPGPITPPRCGRRTPARCATRT
jgi:hypothetical protein